MENSIDNLEKNQNFSEEKPVINLKIDKTKLYCILSYVYILWLAGLLSERENKIIRFHVNQGIILSIFMFSSLFAINIISDILFFIAPILSCISALFQILWLIIFFSLSFIGIRNVIKNKAKPLPIIGNLFTVLK